VNNTYNGKYSQAERREMTSCSIPEFSWRWEKPQKYRSGQSVFKPTFQSQISWIKSIMLNSPPRCSVL